MSLLSLRCFCDPTSITRTSHMFYTVRSKTSTEGTNVGRFGRQYGEPTPQYQICIRNKPSTISRRREVLGRYSEKDLDLNDVVHPKKSTETSLLNGIYQFTRPHVIFGTILTTSMISTLALSSWTQLSPALLWEVCKAVFPAILMNIYICGINQLYDVEIDKVNKPDLPLAAGVLSMNWGLGITVTTLITSFALGMRYGSPAIMGALLCLFLMGSVYSIELPFMRWKRSPFLASVAIIVMRAVAMPFGYFIHMQKYVLGEPIVLSKTILFTAWFMFLFSIVNSLSKDIPDVEGDKMHGFMTFSVLLGKERVYWICVSVLMAIYGGAVALGVTCSSLSNKLVSVLGHLLLSAILMRQALKDDNVDTFHMLTWKLLFAEHLLLPFMR